MDQIDRKIISTLKYGRKKQVEIVELLEGDVSGRSVRRHLERLKQEGELGREGNDGPYFLPNQQRKPVQPKPYADQDEVNRVLFNIEKELGIIQSEIENSLSDNKICDKLLSSINATGSELSETELVKQRNDVVENISQLYDITGRCHYILQNRENLNSFFRIFDSILETLDSYNREMDVLLLPDEIFKLFFMSANNLYNNWYDGKENENFDARMLERSDEVVSIVSNSEAKFHSNLRMVLSNISRESGKEVYISMVKSGNYCKENLLEDAFYTYDSFNMIHELLRDLDKAKQEVNDEETAQDIHQLKNEIVRLYTREIQDTV